MSNVDRCVDAYVVSASSLSVAPPNADGLQQIVEDHHRKYSTSPGYMFVGGSVSRTKRSNPATSIDRNGRATIKWWMRWGRPEKVFGWTVLAACLLFYIWKHVF